MDTPVDKVPHRTVGAASADPTSLDVPAHSWRDRIYVFFAVALLYLLPGLTGHDPWKQDETYITDIVRHMLDSGDWTVPTMAGAPFMEKPPLYYWVAALCARLFAPMLAIHDGARIATAVFLGCTCAAVAWIGQRWWGRNRGRVCVVALLSCLGMALHAHFMLTDIATMAGFAIALSGLALCLDKAALGGLMLGTGVGIGFLGKGLLAPGVLGACALLLPLLFDRWRQARYGRALAIACVAAAPSLLIWPALLLHRSPQLFIDWLWLNNIGRFVGFSVPLLGAEHSKWFWLTTLPWFTFPAFPLAMLSLWRQRSTALSQESFQISLVLCVTLLVVLWQSASARNNYALPLLLPLALIAAPAASALPELADRCCSWLARILWGGVASIVWGTWLYMIARGAPPHLPIIGNYLPADFTPKFVAEAFIAALALTVAPLFLANYLIRFCGEGLTAWFTGLAICWALIACLWLPWIDAAKSYRSVFDAVKTALPYGYGCVAESGMGESELSMLSYFLGITSVRSDSARADSCSVLLVNGRANSPPRDIAAGRWVLTWEGARPGDRDERFWLYSARSSSRK
ncbi:MAG: glycosyltransferase family 39 protein [Massilia sp.]|nr:glycosyltransferase family 39 protein [Massilia sp.]